MKDSSNTINSLAHTKWNCKYHIVFAPKYRRKVFYDEHRLEVREILRKLCEWKGVEVIEGEICPDHIHMLVSIPPKMSVSVFMGYLKGKSVTIIFQKWGNMKFAYRNREFWCKGYYVDTVTYFYGHCDCFSIATEVRCDVAQNERRYYQGEYSGFQFCQWERWIDLRNRDGVIPVIFLNWRAKYCGEQ